MELVLSDLHTFFAKLLARLTDEANPSESDTSTTKQRVLDPTTRREQRSLAAAGKKIAFYIASVRAVRRQHGRRVWSELSAEIGKEIVSLRREMEDTQDETTPDGYAEEHGVRRIEGLTDLDGSPFSPADFGKAPIVARIEAEL